MFRLTVLLESRWFLLLDNISKESFFWVFCNAPSGAGLSSSEMLAWVQKPAHPWAGASLVHQSVRWILGLDTAGSCFGAC